MVQDRWSYGVKSRDGTRKYEIDILCQEVRDPHKDGEKQRTPIARKKGY